LLGRHVSHNFTVRNVAHQGVVDRTCSVEVDEPDGASFVEQHVVRLEISVHIAVLVDMG
jgi:hypothetical protein